MADDDKDLSEEERKKRDLRYTAHEQDNVRVERSLDQSGHLARGDKTHMSVLNFSSRHQARPTERDPDFEFRSAPAKPKQPDPEVPSTKAAAAPPEPPPAPAASATPVDASPSVLARVKRLFGF